MSYRIIHDKNMPRAELVHEFTIHRGMLFAALPSLIVLSLAALETITIRTALIADVTIAIAALTIGILRSGKTKSNSFTTALLSVGIQAVIVGGIVLLKIGAK
jgi:hypothetical protein